MAQLLVVLEDHVFNVYFRTKQFPLVVYFIFAEKKSDQILFMATTTWVLLET